MYLVHHHPTVQGFIIDQNKQKLRFLYGRWTEFLCSADPASLVALLGCKLEKVSKMYTALHLTTLHCTSLYLTIPHCTPLRCTHCRQCTLDALAQKYAGLHIHVPDQPRRE